MVGLVNASNSGFTSVTDQDQVDLVMASIADLFPVLPKAKQDQVKADLTRLTRHNWGYVRRAAESALGKMAKP